MTRKQIEKITKMAKGDNEMKHLACILFLSLDHSIKDFRQIASELFPDRAVGIMDGMYDFQYRYLKKLYNTDKEHPHLHMVLNFANHLI